MPNPIHHQRGARGPSTRSLTSSLKDRKVTPGRMIGAVSAGSAARVYALSLLISGLGLRMIAA
jgi:hypothetical protein